MTILRVFVCFFLIINLIEATNASKEEEPDVAVTAAESDKQTNESPEISAESEETNEINNSIDESTESSSVPIQTKEQTTTAEPEQITAGSKETNEPEKTTDLPKETFTESIVSTSVPIETKEQTTAEPEQITAASTELTTVPTEAIIETTTASTESTTEPTEAIIETTTATTEQITTKATESTTVPTEAIIETTTATTESTTVPTEAIIETTTATTESTTVLTEAIIETTTATTEQITTKATESTTVPTEAIIETSTATTEQITTETTESTTIPTEAIIETTTATTEQITTKSTESTCAPTETIETTTVETFGINEPARKNLQLIRPCQKSKETRKKCKKLKGNIVKIFEVRHVKINKRVIITHANKSRTKTKGNKLNRKFRRRNFQNKAVINVGKPKAKTKSNKPNRKFQRRNFQNEEVINIGDRIFERPNIQNVKYVVSIHLKSENEYKCGGSIISRSFVLSSAHCFVKRPSDPNSYYFHVGLPTKESPGPKYEFSKLEIHYTSLNIIEGHDIALLETSKPIDFTPNVEPIPIKIGQVPVGETVTISGWGKSKTLQFGHSEVLEHKSCKQAFGFVNEQIHFCIKKSDPGFCEGDSGSPLVYKEALVGLIFFASGCAEHNPDVSTKVNYYISWIMYTISKMGGKAMSQNDFPTFVD